MKLVDWQDYIDHPSECIDMDWVLLRHENLYLGMVATPVPQDEWWRLNVFANFVIRQHDDIKIEALYTALITKDTEVSDTDDDYSYGFPHTHNNGRTACAIVIQAPKEGGHTTVETSDEFFSLKPVVGRGCIIESDEEHGVMRVIGDIPRIAVIAQYTVL